MNEAGIQAQLVREFLSKGRRKGLRKAAIQSIELHLDKLELQASVLRNIARELLLEDEAENLSGAREE